MTSMSKEIEQAKRVLRIESEAILSLIPRLNQAFTSAVKILFDCRGRAVLTGMGKSGFVANKIAATLASTGTPAFFMHPAEGIHGDLGMVVKGDVVIAISNSGETDEIINLLPAIKRLGVQLISLVGNRNSTLARMSDVTLDVSVAEEACPLGLAPTASTTAALAMGDALAAVLLEQRGFKAEDFALFHPGGSIGRRLLVRVRDLMHKDREVPATKEDALMKDAILEITSKKLGVTSIVDDREALVGILTDGDLRRALERGENILAHPVSQYMTRNPKVIGEEELAAKALQLMETYAITSLLILDDQRRVKGIIHMHDILKAGVV
jgi:arabinose-5-phosphate isomerase